MPLIPWRPWLWRPWEEFEKELEDWFEERWPEIKQAEFMPPVDIYEKGNNIIVETQISGIEPEKVDISVEDNTLILKGKSEKKSEVEEKNYYRKEVRYGSFYRALSLPTKVIGEKAEATYENGILKIVIPKAAEVKAKKIKVKVKKSKS
ncbi:MAG: Hsp20/alpha crystallin family protein [Patescibacteria group bacterium]